MYYGAFRIRKSTLLNNISTIDIPNKGHVYIDTSEITTMSEKEIGYFRYEKLGFIFKIIVYCNL